MSTQEKFKYKIFLCPLVSSLPPLWILYLHYDLTKPPHQQEHLLNQKEQYNTLLALTTP